MKFGKNKSSNVVQTSVCMLFIILQTEVCATKINSVQKAEFIFFVQYCGKQIFKTTL